MSLFSEFFIWWSGNTWGTRLDTWLHGEFVGEDDQGNRYYRAKPGAKKPNRRWVVYNGYPEPSRIPAGWHGWMHYRTDVPPTEQEYKGWSWQEPHEPNLTGTPLAYRPDGSLLNKGERPKVTGDYEAWSPE
jgi:NADH:ubiquinone oxidoreductase subunit